MRIEEIKSALQASVEPDILDLFTTWKAQSGSEDLDEFLVHLQTTGVITEELLRSVQADLKSSLATKPESDPEASEKEKEKEKAKPRRRRESDSRSGARRRRRREGVGTDAGQMGTTGSGIRKRRSTGGGTGGSNGRSQPIEIPDPNVPSKERYDFIGSVGAGAMGQVHLALDKLLHRRVAFKQITARMAKHGTMAAKFQMEAQITAQLDHPNIVPVYTLERSPDNLAAYTMKLIKGETLEDLIVAGIEVHQKRETAPAELSIDRMLEQFLKVCDAMHYAHSRGVVHRDLKPENIMVGSYGEIYVMDWGISRPFSTDVDDPVSVGTPDDEDDMVIGTPQYMSPEQASGENATLDHRSDQYSLGLILFELLSFNQAVTGKAPMKIVLRQTEGDKNPLVHVNPSIKIPPELHAIVMKTTHREPKHRYPNVFELAQDIRRFQRGEAVLAKRDTLWQALMRFMRRHQQLTLAFIMFLIMSSGFSLVMVVGIYQYQLSQQRYQEGLTSQLLTTVSAQASLIDGQFLKYEGLLSVLAVTATDLIDGKQVDDTSHPYFLDDAFTPPDLAKSKRYDSEISLAHPVYVVSRGVDPATVAPTVRSLLPMQRHYYQVMLRSLNEEAAVMGPSRARRAISDVGVPLAWAYVATPNGVYQSYPGHTGYPNSFDGRTRPWYELAEKTNGPTWGAPHGDISGMGLILSCAQSLRDDEGTLLGVAGLDVTFDFLIEELIEIEEFTGVSEAFLLDDEGRVVVQSSRKGQKVAGTGRELRLSAFPVDEVVEQIHNMKSGYATTEDGQIVVYNRMNSLGWYYAVMGDQDALLSAVEDDS